MGGIEPPWTGSRSQWVASTLHTGQARLCRDADRPLGASGDAGGLRSPPSGRSARRSRDAGRGGAGAAARRASSPSPTVAHHRSTAVVRSAAALALVASERAASLEQVHAVTWTRTRNSGSGDPRDGPFHYDSDGVVPSARTLDGGCRRAPPAGLEPASSWFVARCSDPLELRGLSELRAPGRCPMPNSWITCGWRSWTDGTRTRFPLGHGQVSRRLRLRSTRCGAPSAPRHALRVGPAQDGSGLAVESRRAVAALPRAGVAPAPPGFHPGARLSSCRGVGKRRSSLEPPARGRVKGVSTADEQHAASPGRRARAFATHGERGSRGRATLAPSEGVEPSRPRVTGGRSSVELRRRTDTGRSLPARPRFGCQRRCPSRGGRTSAPSRGSRPRTSGQSRTLCRRNRSA